MAIYQGNERGLIAATKPIEQMELFKGSAFCKTLQFAHDPDLPPVVALYSIERKG